MRENDIEKGTAFICCHGEAGAKRASEGGESGQARGGYSRTPKPHYEFTTGIVQLPGQRHARGQELVC